MARDAVAAALTVFGPQLVSAYLIGSLAHEGFVAAVSDIDIDIAVIVEGDDPGDPTRVAEISRRVLEQARSPLAKCLSVFWSTADALRSGQPHGPPARDRLAGPDRQRRTRPRRRPADEHPRPTPEQLIEDAAAFAVRKWRDDPDWDLLDTAGLMHQGRRAAANAALFPVRFLYILATGRAGGTHHAVSWYATQFQASDSAGDYVGRHVARPPLPVDVWPGGRDIVDAAVQSVLVDQWTQLRVASSKSSAPPRGGCGCRGEHQGRAHSPTPARKA